MAAVHLRRGGQCAVAGKQRQDSAFRITADEPTRIGFAELIAEQFIEQACVDRRRGVGRSFVHDWQIRTNPQKSANTNVTGMNRYNKMQCAGIEWLFSVLVAAPGYPPTSCFKYCFHVIRVSFSSSPRVMIRKVDELAVLTKMV